MKKYFNIAVFLGLVLLTRGLYGFYSFFKTGCIDGNWGSGSCGAEAITTAVVIFTAGLIVLFLSIQSIHSKNNTTTKNKDRRF